MQMQADGVSRRDLLSGIAGAAIVAAPGLANAEVEYANVPFLGGSDQVLLTAACSASESAHFTCSWLQNSARQGWC